MARMTLGGYTFVSNPSDTDTVIRQVKRCASVITYSNVGFFDWGPSIVGKEVELIWNSMPATMYDSLEALYLAAGPHVWDPQDDESHTFNVHIKSLNGRYLVTMGDTIGSRAAQRRDVRMVLIIMSQAS
jgi:hypothetical protein